MTILGIGSSELVLIILLIIVILGPERAPQAAREVGKRWRAFTRSETWRTIVKSMSVARNLPQTLVRLAEVEEVQAKLAQDLEQVQQQFKTVSEPTKEILSGAAMREAIQATETELKQSLSQSPSSETAVESRAKQTKATTTELPVEHSIAPPDLTPDADTMTPEQKLIGYVEAIPTAFERLDRLEKSQAGLIAQIQSIQQSIDSLLAFSKAKAES